MQANNLRENEEHKAEMCPNCDGNTFDTEWKEQSFQYGAAESPAELSAYFPVLTCQKCGYQFTDERAELAKHEAVCHHLRVMTPADIVKLREKYAMSRSQLAELSRLGPASIARWEAGIVIQNAGNDQLLYLLQFEDNVQRLLNRSSNETTVGGVVEINGSASCADNKQENVHYLAASAAAGSGRHRCTIRARTRALVDVDAKRQIARSWNL